MTPDAQQGQILVGVSVVGVVFVVASVLAWWRCCRSSCDGIIAVVWLVSVGTTLHMDGTPDGTTESVVADVA